MQGHGVPCLNNAPSNEPENVLMYSPDVARHPTFDGIPPRRGTPRPYICRRELYL